jgi:hypothetical protein
MTISRAYKVKDVDMLLASKTIMTSFTDNLGDLSTIRTDWTDRFATGLTAEIDNAMETYLGLDKKKELRNATSIVMSIQAPALRDLSFLKTQIEVDFGSGAKTFTDALGFGKYLNDARAGDQEALIQLLYAFNTGMDEPMKTAITEKGTNPALIDRIMVYANQLSEANVTQEALKQTTKMISEEAVAVFNTIYNKIIGICKIASSYYNSDTLKKEQFTFSRVVANMGAAQPEKEDIQE